MSINQLSSAWKGTSAFDDHIQCKSQEIDGAYNNPNYAAFVVASFWNNGRNLKSASPPTHVEDKTNPCHESEPK